MTRRKVEVDGVMQTIASFEAPAAGERSCALMRIVVSDEMTRQPPRTTISARLIQPLSAGVSARVVDSGLIGVSGRPARAFTPTLASTGRIDVEVSAPGFTTRRLAVEFACSLRTLSLPASGTVVKLDSNSGLKVGQRMLLSTPGGGQVEFATLATIGPGVNEVTLAQAPTLPYPPGSFVQPLPPDQILEAHHTPVSIRGRILKKTGTVIAPLANAQVSIAKTWRVLPVAGTTSAPEPPVPGLPPPPAWPAPIASIWPPIYADMPDTTTLDVEDRPVDGVMSAKTVLDDVPAGATDLRVSNSSNLSVNDILAIDADDPGRREIVCALKVTPSASAGDWARLIINQPFALAHRRGAIVRRLQATAPSLSKPLNYAAGRGDEVVLFDTRTFSGGHQVCLTPPAGLNARSFHRVVKLETRSDSAGFYRLPPLTRAGKVEIYVKDSGSAADRAVEFIPDYEQPENPLDITI